MDALGRSAINVGPTSRGDGRPTARPWGADSRLVRGKVPAACPAREAEGNAGGESKAPGNAAPVNGGA